MGVAIKEIVRRPWLFPAFARRRFTRLRRHQQQTFRAIEWPLLAVAPSRRRLSRCLRIPLTALKRPLWDVQPPIIETLSESEALAANLKE